jgi:hypothetical protein
MKRNLLTILSVIALMFSVNGQTILFQENFESYNAGGFLVQQAGSPWTTWSNQPGGGEDAVISTDQAYSPTKSVHIQNAVDDLILKLGNKTSGRYAIEFYYFIPTGFGAYFNIQHFEAPGIEWAIEVYFGNNGTGETSVNSIVEPFSHVMNTWMKIETIVDLELDSAWLYIDDSPIREWQFSMQSNAPTGTKQLGGINFYGGAIQGQSPQYYFDDVKFTQLVAGTNPPEISLSTNQIVTDGTANEVFTVSNLGDVQMSFVAYPVFPEDGSKNLIINENDSPVEYLGLGGTFRQNDLSFDTRADKINELSFVNGTLDGGLGFPSTVNAVRAGVKFDYNFINQYIGRELVSVTIGINELPSGVTKILVYDRGSFVTPGAGDLLTEEPFTAVTPVSEITVNLSSPIYLDGKDIWIGYTCDAIGGTFPFGIDMGPRVPGVNWLAVGPGWSEMNLTVDNNLYIMGTLQGSSIHQWLSVSPQVGVISGGSQQTITASFNTTGMTSGDYTAMVVIGCNDQTQEYSEVEVNLTIGASINENDEHVSVITFPNPVSDMFNIQANTPLKKVEVYDISGKLMKMFSVEHAVFTFSVADLPGGLYSVIITTESERFSRKIIVE